MIRRLEYLTITFRSPPLPQLHLTLYEYIETLLQLLAPSLIPDLGSKAEQVQRHIDLVRYHIDRILVLVIYTIFKQYSAVLLHILQEIHLGGTVAMRVFSENLVFVLDSVMNLNPVAYRTKQYRNIMNMSPEVFQRAVRPNHACATTKAHVRSPPIIHLSVQSLNPSIAIEKDCYVSIRVRLAYQAALYLYRHFLSNL